MLGLSAGTTLSSHSEVRKYLVASVFPVLLPALVELTKYVEKEGGGVIAAPDPQEPFDMQSVPLRLYILKNVAPTLNAGLEYLFRLQPFDPIDSLAQFLFERSGDHGPEDDGVNPVHWLAQFLFRNNPEHSAPRDAVQHEFQMTMPQPTKKRNPRASTPERVASPRTYPAKLEPPKTVTVPSSVPVPLAPGGHQYPIYHGQRALDGRRVAMTVVRDDEKRSLVFHAWDANLQRMYSATLNEGQAHSLLSRTDAWKVNLATAAKELVSLVVLVRRFHRTRLSFVGLDDANVAPLLWQGSVNLGGRVCIVEVFRQGRGRADLLLFKAYDPETSASYSTIYQERMSEDVATRQQQLSALANRLRLVTTRSGTAVTFPLVTTGTQVSGERVIVSSCLYREETPENDAKVDVNEEDAADMVKVLFQVHRPGECAFLETAVPFEMLSLRRPLSKAGVGADGGLTAEDARPVLHLIRKLRLVDGVLRMNDGNGSAVSRRLRDARQLDAAFAPMLDRASDDAHRRQQGTIDTREALWKLRRDQQFQRRREAHAPPAVAFRRGVRVTGRFMLVTVTVGAACRNGWIQFEAYDQTTSETFALTVTHRDTRGLRPEGDEPGALLTGPAERRALALVNRLELERDFHGQLNLVLTEESSYATKLRRAFEALDRDQRGHAKTEDVLAVLKHMLEEVTFFLNDISAQQAKHARRFIHAVTLATEAHARDRVSWEQFCAFLDVPTPGVPPRTSAPAVVRASQRRIGGRDLALTFIADPLRQLKSVLVRALDSQARVEYSLDVSPAQLARLLPTTATLDEAAAEIERSLRLVPAVVPAVGAPPVDMDHVPQVVTQGAYSVGGYMAVVTLYDDRHVRFFVSPLSTWYYLRVDFMLPESAFATKQVLRQYLARVVLSVPGSAGSSDEAGDSAGDGSGSSSEAPDAAVAPPSGEVPMVLLVE